MQPESAIFLCEMLDAVESIIAITHDKTEEDFLSSRTMRNTVQWDFAVIGEALSQLYKSDPAADERISEWSRIISFRNQLIHGYRIIRNAVTWSIVQEKAPILRRELEELLRA